MAHDFEVQLLWQNDIQLLQNGNEVFPSIKKRWFAKPIIRKTDA
jgi:hypothetical protein